MEIRHSRVYERRLIMAYFAGNVSRASSIEMHNTIKNAVTTMSVCSVPRFKQSILYELLEYLFEKKSELHVLGKAFGMSIELVINDHLNSPTRIDLKMRLAKYKAGMSPYFDWCKTGAATR